MSNEAKSKPINDISLLQEIVREAGCEADEESLQSFVTIYGQSCQSIAEVEWSILAREGRAAYPKVSILIV